MYLNSQQWGKLFAPVLYTARTAMSGIISYLKNEKYIKYPALSVSLVVPYLKFWINWLIFMGVGMNIISSKDILVLQFI